MAHPYRKSPLQNSSLEDKARTAFDIGSNFLKGVGGVAASLLSTTPAYGGQKSLSEHKKQFLDIPNYDEEGGALPFPISNKNEDTALPSPVDKVAKTTKGKGRNFRSADEGAGMTEKGLSLIHI